MDIPFQLAKRNGNLTCWAQYDTLHEGRICISKELWKSWLDAPSRKEGIQVVFKSKIFSPPINDPSDSVGEKRKKLITEILLHSSPRLIPDLLLPLEKLRENISSLLEPFDSLGIFRQLVVGQSSAHGVGEMLEFLGIVHALCPSGIHLIFLAYFTGELFKLSLIKCEAFLNFRPPLRLALYAYHVATSAIWLYAWVLSGARLGMLRPLLVIAMKRAAFLLGIRWRTWAPLAIALSIDIALQAYLSIAGVTPFPEGRWHYALSVAGGILVLEAKPNRQHLCFTIGSWIFIALFIGWNHGVIAIATPVLSLITIPWVGLIYPVLIVSSIFSLIHLRFLALLLTRSSIQTGNVAFAALLRILLSTPSLWVLPNWAILMGCSLAGGLIWSMGFVSRAWKKILILVAISGVAVFRTFSLAHEEPSSPSKASGVEQLDVGQGDASLIESGLAGLIDVGGENALNDRAWIELFAKRGLTHIDWIAFTHLDQDHIGGIRKLLNLIPIHCVATSREELETSRGQKLKDELELYGISIKDWNAGCVPFPVLPPLRLEDHANANMSAVFVPLRSGGFYLSAGDAGFAEELRFGPWAESLARKLPAGPRILKISHHGSKYSTSLTFLNEIHPTEAWISSGVGNHYGHPSVRVLALLTARRIPIHRTDQEGLLREGASLHLR